MKLPVAMFVQRTWPTELSPLGDLPRVMLGMNHVELEPLVGGERPQDWVIEHLSRPKRGFRFDRRLVKPRQIAAHRIEDGVEIELAGRDDVFRRLTAFRKISEVHQPELLHPLFERG